VHSLPSVAPYPYVRHRPELTLLYQVIEHHLPEFKAELRDQHRALPRFVLREFDDYLRCGRLEHGFVRVKCTGSRTSVPWLRALASCSSVGTARRGTTPRPSVSPWSRPVGFTTRRLIVLADGRCIPICRELL
jgi:hypothetical protein